MEEEKQSSKEEKKLENNEGKMKSNSFVKILQETDKKNLVIGCLILIIIIGVFFINSGNKKNIPEEYKFNYEDVFVVKHNVKIHIDFTENLLFSKYNVILSIGDKKETLTHGENKDIEISLAEGNYTLTFTNSEDSTIKNETTIDVKNDMQVGYKISCHYDRISVENLYVDIEEEIKQDEVKMKNDKSEYVYKNYKDVIKKLEDLGFTNIVEKPMYDIVIGLTEEGEVDKVTINGSDSYKRGDIFKKDTEVVVSYHMKKEDDPSNKVDNIEKEDTNVANENQISNENKTSNENQISDESEISNENKKMMKKKKILKKIK